MTAAWASPHVLLLCTAALFAVPCQAAGGVSLWNLGQLVDENPLTVFTMFVFTVILVLAIEIGKHKVDHGTQDPHRKQALSAIYSELMIMGVVSFLLILGAELGLTDVRIQKPWCDSGSGSGAGAAPVDSGSGSGSGANASSAAGSAAAAGSSSSSTDPCEIGFDLLMFEYAHLVLFFMGLTYAMFIQVAFMQRGRMCANIEELQQRTLASWLPEDSSHKRVYKPAGLCSIMGLCGRSGAKKGKSAFARAVLTLRSAMCVHLGDDLRDACDPGEVQLENMLAKLHGEPIPSARADPKNAQQAFSVSRFLMRGMGEVLVEMLHVPPIVWGVVLLMAAESLLKLAGVDLAIAVLIMSATSPLLSFILLWRMSAHLQGLADDAIAHPGFPEVEYAKATGLRVSAYNVPDKLAKKGKEWGNDRQKHPWTALDGCIDDNSKFNFLDPLDPHNLVLQMQGIIYSACFNVGQMTMLSTMIIDHMGFGVLLACWILPLIPLFVIVPRAILIYTMCHRTAEPPRSWMVYALKEKDDPVAGHGHGHDDHHEEHEHMHHEFLGEDDVQKLALALHHDESMSTEDGGEKKVVEDVPAANPLLVETERAPTKDAKDLRLQLQIQQIIHDKEVAMLRRQLQGMMRDAYSPHARKKRPGPASHSPSRQMSTASQLTAPAVLPRTGSGVRFERRATSSGLSGLSGLDSANSRGTPVAAKPAGGRGARGAPAAPPARVRPRQGSQISADGGSPGRARVHAGRRSPHQSPPNRASVRSVVMQH